MRITSLWKIAVATVVLTAAGASAQTLTPVKPMAADAHPSFAVATIKPHDPNSNRGGFNAVGDRYSVGNRTVVSLVMFAYSVHQHQIVDAPAWAGTERFDIEGTIDTPGEPNLRQQQEMLQKLLADRFGLKFHRETRELPVYAIEIAKGGVKLKPAAHPEAESDQDASSHGTEVTLRFTNASMADFIMGMQFSLDRPLVDRTGIPGRHDFTLRHTYDEAHVTDPDAPPGLFTAVKEQLGLRLDAVKAPIGVLASDRVEVLSAN